MNSQQMNEFSKRNIHFIVIANEQVEVASMIRSRRLHNSFAELYCTANFVAFRPYQLDTNHTHFRPTICASDYTVSEKSKPLDIAQ